MLDLPEATPLKKINSLSPSIYQLPIAPHLGVNLWSSCDIPLLSFKRALVQNQPFINWQSKTEANTVRHHRTPMAKIDKGTKNSLWRKQSQVPGLCIHDSHGRYWVGCPGHLKFYCLGNWRRRRYLTVYYAVRHTKGIVAGTKLSPGIQEWHLPCTRTDPATFPLPAERKIRRPAL